MKNKALRLCLSSLLMFGSLSILATITAVPTLAITPKDCVAQTPANYFAGDAMYPSGFATVRGVQARIWSEGRIEKCNGVGTTGEGGSAWIAVTEYGSSSFSAILQIGLIHCFDQFYVGAICDDGGENQKWLFYAKGGCNGAQPYATKIGADNAEPGDYLFRMYRLTGGDWVLRYDHPGTGEWGTVTIQSTDPAVNCWIHDTLQAEYSGELWNSADIVGNAATTVLFRDARFRVSIYDNPTDGWHIPGATYGSKLVCSNFPDPIEPHEFLCDNPGTIGDKLNLWVTPG